MRSAVLVRGMFRRSWIEFVRYAFESVTGLVALMLVFALVFYGARSLLGPGADSQSSLSSIVAGYAVWTLAIFVHTAAAHELTLEATAGTLEQLAMSPLGLRTVMLARFVSGLTFQMVTFSILLFLMMLISGRWLNIDIPSLLPLILLTLLGMEGAGLMLGGLAMVFKRVQSFLQIMQFVWVALIAAPLDRVGWVKFLPLSSGAELIDRVAVEGTSLGAIGGGDLLFLVVHSFAWLALGLYVFGRLEVVARDRALLGQY